jgi:hypothetical protein
LIKTLGLTELVISDSDGDSALVVELWLHRVVDDLSGLTFHEWDPSAGTDDTSAPVAAVRKLQSWRKLSHYRQ